MALGLWLFGLGLLMWYPLRWWPGDSFWPVRLFNYGMPWLLAGLLPGLGLAGILRRKWLTIALAIPTLLIGLAYAPLFLPRPELVWAATPSFTIMSYNIWGRNERLDEVVRLIKQEQPDIILLQEVYPPLGGYLAAQLLDLYPGQKAYAAYEPWAGQAIISRYPLTQVDYVRAEGRAQKVQVDTPAGPIIVWNIHPHQPMPWARHYQQIAALAESIAKNKGPLIVGGDFNTTDQSEAYQLINQYLQNAHWEAGWGFGFSFPSYDRALADVSTLVGPVVRIDHIFYSQHFTARSARTLRESAGSDHFPVVAELTLSQIQ
jgi:endonuclease/exonuclease/phosphatase (EEP) superfamily protein YafD